MILIRYVRLFESEESDTSTLHLLESPSLPAIEVGMQVSKSSAIHFSPDYLCDFTDTLSYNVDQNANFSGNHSVDTSLSSEQPRLYESPLDPRAPSFIPLQSFDTEILECSDKCLNIGTQTLVESSDDTAFTPVVDQTSSIQVVKSLFESSDVDDDITQLKTKFDPGGLSSETDMAINEESGLPEHVHALFMKTFEQADFAVESVDGLKQLLYDLCFVFVRLRLLYDTQT